MTITDFILARVAEDEAVALAANGPRSSAVDPDAGTPKAGHFGHVITGGMYQTAWPNDAAHIARNDPARVLAQCAATRAIVKLHNRPHECSTYDHNGEVDNCTWCANGSECSTLRALASVWADHPDYDPAWAIENEEKGS